MQPHTPLRPRLESTQLPPTWGKRFAAGAIFVVIGGASIAAFVQVVRAFLEWCR